MAVDRYLTNAIPSAISAYFQALDAGDGQRAATAFASTAVMRLPAPIGASERVGPVLRSGEISEMLSGRGVPEWHHELIDAANVGSTWLLEGAVVGGAANATFLVAIDLDDDDVIQEYTAFRSDRRVVRPDPPPVIDQRRCNERFRSMIEAWNDPRAVDDDSNASTEMALHASGMPGAATGLLTMNCRHVAAGRMLVFAFGTAVQVGSESDSYRFMMSAECATRASWDQLLCCWASMEGTSR